MSLDLFINLFENKTPTPIAKNTTSGICLYGSSVYSVNPPNKDPEKSIQPKKNMDEFAY